MRNNWVFFKASKTLSYSVSSLTQRLMSANPQAGPALGQVFRASAAGPDSLVPCFQQGRVWRRLTTGHSHSAG